MKAERVPARKVRTETTPARASRRAVWDQTPASQLEGSNSPRVLVCSEHLGQKQIDVA